MNDKMIPPWFLAEQAKNDPQESAKPSGVTEEGFMESVEHLLTEEEAELLFGPRDF